MIEGPFIRPERRRWERENWPRWERLIRFKSIKLANKGFRWPPVLEHSDPRTKAEMVVFIDQMLKDLGEVE